MLGWFKKKLKKQTPEVVPDVAVEEELSQPSPPEEEVDPADQKTASTPEEDAVATLADDAPEPEPAPEPATQPAPEPAKEPAENPALAKHTPEAAILPKEEKEPPKHPADRSSSGREDMGSAKKRSLFSRLTERLSKTRESFTYQLDALFLGKKEIDEDLIDDLEEILIMADLGVSTTQELLEYARRKVKRKELDDPNSLKEALKRKIKEFITDNDADATLVMPKEGPFVIMVIGVNGVGKTTTIGKIANKFLKSGSSVLLVAADTFRAAAVSQLKIWGERNNVEVIAHQEGADPSSVVYDGLGVAIARNIDVVLVDTAGRLHTKANLMEELKKIKRVMAKRLAGAPHEILLVIDATTGQNGVSQARLFNEAIDVSGLALTKLDGTSKGGIVANICKELKIPIRFIGIGEKMDDLRDFDPEEFAEALFHNPRR
jgi:fused signal recognition particle receptor